MGVSNNQTGIMMAQLVRENKGWQFWRYQSGEGACLWHLTLAIYWGVWLCTSPRLSNVLLNIRWSHCPHTKDSGFRVFNAIIIKGIISPFRITVSLALPRSERHSTLLFSCSAFFLKLSSSLVTAVSPSPSWSRLAHPAACITALGLRYPTIYFLSAFCKSLTLGSNLFSPCHPKAETSSDLLSAVCVP